jgi:hypothetical protein
MKKGLEGRARALEGAFFARQEQELIDGLRSQRDKEDLERATGIHDPKLLDLAAGEGIRVDTLVALLLAPMVEIAWADGRVTTLERHTFHEELRGLGIRPDGPAGQILERWLEVGPPEGLMEAWFAYVAELGRTMETGVFGQLGDHIVRLCRSEADSDGGVLRIGRRPSRAEAAIIEQVESAFGLV